MKAKYYKLTLARIGKQESWAGWKIAGKSEDTPMQVAESFESFHSSKNHVVSTVIKPIELYEIADFKGSLFVSSIRFGMKDMLGRPSFYTKGIVFPFSENPNIYEHPETFLSLTPEDFDFKLKPLYDVSRNLKPEYITGVNIVTIHDNEAGFKRELDLEAIIAKYFASPAKLERFVRAVFWAGNNNQMVLTIRVPRGFTDFFEIMYLIYSILPLNMRSAFSCRTRNIRGLTGAKIVFDEEMSIGKFYDLASGNDNIFTDVNILNNSRRLTFIQHILDNISTGDNPDYFQILQETLVQMGQPQTTDLNTVEMAHAMLMGGGSSETDGELDEMGILKKFQEYVSLDSNEVVDENIVKYLTLIINNGITLNETLMEKLEKKLEITQYQPLIDLGYRFKVGRLLNVAEKGDSFAFLYGLEDCAPNKDNYFRYILADAKGPAFLDEYYVEYYAKTKERVRESGDLSVFLDDLKEFYGKTKSLPDRTKIDRYIYNQAVSIANRTVEELLLKGKKDRSFRVDEFSLTLTQRLGLSAIRAKDITEEMKKTYWSRFDFQKFDYSRIEDYLGYFPYYNWQYEFIRHLKVNVLDVAPELNPKTIRLFNSMLAGQNDRKVRLDSIEKRRLISGFRNYCLLNRSLDQSKGLDFWYEMAHLSVEQPTMDSVTNFIFSNHIKVFTEPRYFKPAYEQSELYCNRRVDQKAMKKYAHFMKCMKHYIEDHSQYDEIWRLIEYYDKKDAGGFEIYSRSSIEKKAKADLKNAASRVRTDEKKAERNRDKAVDRKNEKDDGPAKSKGSLFPWKK